MVVQHNLTAMNSNRMLGLTTKAQAKTTEKLSSGYKINRAADDAAGLAISEKMRKQIRGLTQASLNAQDGISAVQTAEGALTEVHDMLQRMNELAVKAGNGTQSESDRQSIQDEIDQLITEIDRVSETTKFNETYLLKGSGKNKNAGEVSAKIDGKTQDANIAKATGNIFKGVMDMSDATKLDAGTEDKATITYLDAEGNKKTREVTFKTGNDAKSTAANLAAAINGDKELKKIFKASSSASGELSVESRLDGNKTDSTKNSVSKIDFESATKETDPNDTTGAATPTQDFGTSDMLLKDGESITINGKTYTFDAGKADSMANSFKTLEDLQKILGDDYEVELYASADKNTITYSNKTGATDKTDKVDAEAVVATEKVTTNVTGTAGTVGLDTITQANLGADLYQNDIKDITNNVAASEAGKVIGADTVYTNITLELRITEKAKPEQEQDAINFSLQVGADTTEENKIAVDIESMSAKSLGIENVSVTGPDSTNADEAVNTIAEAIAQVSKQRSALGAVQNRLEHTINNLDNVVENTTSAESSIRDTDMATEMVKYSNSNILAQAGQAMLAQANQTNQGVLSLLG